jgi:uncharacterized protein (UPF0332 family)
VSPRSAEFFDAAERRFAAARRVIGHDAATAISLAYYAMFYAARAALSERDAYAKTHAGAWSEFQRVFVASGLFDGDLLADARPVAEADRRYDLQLGGVSRIDSPSTKA